MSAQPKTDRTPEQWEELLHAAPLDCFARVWQERAPAEKDAVRSHLVALIKAKIERGEPKLTQTGEQVFVEISSRAVVDLTNVLDKMKEEAMDAQRVDKYVALTKQLESKAGNNRMLKITEVSDQSDE